MYAHRVMTRVASIHPIAESTNSRKLPLRIVQPYALGPGLSALSPRSHTLEAVTLIHRRIKILLGASYRVGPGLWCASKANPHTFKASTFTLGLRCIRQRRNRVEGENSRRCEYHVSMGSWL